MKHNTNQADQVHRDGVTSLPCLPTVTRPYINPDPFNSIRSAAAFYRDQCDWIVHPLHGPNEGIEKERGKKPKLRGWKELGLFDCDVAFLEKHFGGKTPANLGVVIQAPHIVIDLDSKKDNGESVRQWLADQPGLETWPREGTAGGVHLHILCEDVPAETIEAAGRNQKLTATLGEGVTAEIFFGGNVVVAPSVHKSGHRYQWEVTGEIPCIPWTKLEKLFFSQTPVKQPQARGRPKKEKPFWTHYRGDLHSLDIVGLAKHLGIYGQPLGGEDGKHTVKCPWRYQHSDANTPWNPGDSSTVIWQAKAGHFPNFFCSHISHGKKTLADLLAWAQSRENGVVDRFCSQIRLWEPGQRGLRKRIRVLLPALNHSDSDFAAVVGDALADKAHWFNKAGLPVEVRKVQDDVSLLVPIKPAAGVTSLEVYVEPGILMKAEGPGDGEQFEFFSKSMSQSQSSILLESSQLREKLPPIERVLHVPIPILKPDGSIVLPKRGYDPEFKSWLDPQAPEIKLMYLDKAKQWIRELLKEFCFSDEQAVVHAVAAVITPFCRGLYPRWTCRTPVFVYEANRPRSGKDYLAGNIALIHEGRDIEDAPIPKDSQELRKKITSALISGRRRMHFANCRDFICSDVLENITTSEQWADRLLGYNQEVTLGNELEFSLSGNIGLTYTPDFANRTRKVSLAFYEEDANGRKFNRTDLKQWTRHHRGELLSAMMAFVTEWHSQRCPKGPTPFTSFPAWAEVVGGIMHACGLGDPCLKNCDEDDALTGDVETRDMRALFCAAYELHRELWVCKADIYALVQDADWFNWIDLETKAGQTKFGMLLGKFVDRELGGIRMLQDQTEKRAARRKLKFTKNEDGRKYRQQDLSKFFDLGPTEVTNVTKDSETVSESPHPLATLVTLATPVTGRDIEKKNESRFLEEGDDEKNIEENKCADVNRVAEVTKVTKVTKPTEWELITDSGVFDSIAEEIAIADHPVALDIETYGADLRNPRRGDIRFLSLGLPCRVPWLIDLQATGYNLGPLGVILASTELVIHNARFDLGFLRHHCSLYARSVFCTLTASQLLSAGTWQSNSLGDVLRRYEIADLPKEHGSSDWGGVIFDDQLAYAAADVAYLHELRARLEDELYSAGLKEVWRLETQLIPVVVGMEAAGFAMDRQRLENIRVEHRLQAAELSGQVQAALGGSFSPNSPEQLQKAFEAAGIRIKGTAEATLARLDHPAAGLTLQMRGADKVAQQAQSLIDAIEADGRIHGQFDPTGTEAGRFAARNPNLQNVGRGELRECFVAPAGAVLVCADYSQIELRVAAALAGERRMIDAYKNGADLHRQTAALVLGKDEADVTKDDRQLAKAVNFGLLYGQSARGLVQYAKTSYGVEMTEGEAERIRERFFRAYQGLADWHTDTRHRAAKNLPETRTRLGRRRLMPQGEEYFWQRFSGGLNTPVQGGAADGLKRALVILSQRLPQGATILSTVHDEIIIECPGDQAEAVSQLMEQSMSEAMAAIYPEVPIEALAHFGYTWAGAK